MGYMPIMWTDTKNPKFFLDFGCRTVGWQQKNQHCLSDFGCRSVGGQQKNQSLKEGVICCGRRTFLLNLPKYPYPKGFYSILFVIISMLSIQSLKFLLLCNLLMDIGIIQPVQIRILTDLIVERDDYGAALNQSHTT